MVAVLPRWQTPAPQTANKSADSSDERETRLPRSLANIGASANALGALQQLAPKEHFGRSQAYGSTRQMQLMCRCWHRQTTHAEGEKQTCRPKAKDAKLAMWPAAAASCCPCGAAAEQ